MQVQKSNYLSTQQFKGKLPSGTKKAIKTFTIDYLKKQDGYVSSKGSIYNGVASTLRLGGGSLATGLGLVALPEVIQHPSFMAGSIEAAALSGGIGGIFVGLSRLETDRAATGQAMIKAKPFVEKLKEVGFAKKDELIYGIKQFMNKKGGFFTSFVPNKVSSQKAEQILNEANMANK